MPELIPTRRHLARRSYGKDGMKLHCSCGEYQSAWGVGTVREQEDAHRAHRVAMGEQVKERALPLRKRVNARVAEMEAELERYVGKEPTVRDEMAYLQRCLNAVFELCDRAAAQAARWESPLPVPEWAIAVREAAEGKRPDTPGDRRRRIYLDGKGNAWVSLTDDTVGPLAGAMWSDETRVSVAARNGGLYEIGRCW